MIIAFWGCGGTGKTTIACGLGSMYAIAKGERSEPVGGRKDTDFRPPKHRALSVRTVRNGEMRGAEALDAQEAARTGHTVTSTLHANSAKQAYARIMTMCQMCAVNVPAHILMGLIVEAFPIAVFCKQMDDNKRCITEVVEAYGAMDGEARTKTLFQYERTADGEIWNRVGAISQRVAELILGNGADEKTVRLFSEDPAAPKAKGGNRK